MTCKSCPNASELQAQIEGLAEDIGDLSEDLSDVEERLSDDKSSSMLRQAKLGLYGALAAETPDDFVGVISAITIPLLLPRIVKGVKQMVRDAGDTISTDQILGIAETLGVPRDAIVAIEGAVTKAKAERVVDDARASVEGVCGKGGCAAPTAVPMTPPVVNGEIVVRPYATAREFADRYETRVTLKGVKREDVVLTRADDGYFIEAPSSATYAEAVTPPGIIFPRSVIAPKGVRVVYRGPVGYGGMGLIGLSNDYPHADVSWDGDELVLTFARKNVERVEIAADTTDKREARIDLALRLATDVGFTVPGGVASGVEERAREIETYLRGASDVDLLAALTEIVKQTEAAYPERSIAVESAFAAVL